MSLDRESVQPKDAAVGDTPSGRAALPNEPSQSQAETRSYPERRPSERSDDPRQSARRTTDRPTTRPNRTDARKADRPHAKSAEQIAEEIESARARMIQPRLGRLSARELEGLMATESRDETWAPAIESAIDDLVASQPVSDYFPSRLVECQESVCRISAVVSRDAIPQEIGSEWQRLMSRLQEQIPSLASYTTLTRVAGVPDTDQSLFTTYIFPKLPPDG